MTATALPETLPPQQQQNLLISSPRTASNMLVKILNLEEQGVRSTPNAGYFWLPALTKRYTLQSKPSAEWTAEEKESLSQVHNQSFDNMQSYVEKAKDEKQQIFIKEHALLLTDPYLESEFIHGSTGSCDPAPPLVPGGGVSGSRSKYNKTSLSDEYLLTWKPTFLIRHPAMTLASLYRKSRAVREGGEPNVVETTMRWARSLFDFYEAHSAENSQYPLVLDADDLIQHPEIAAKYATLVGLDPNKLRFSWDKVPQEQLDKMSGMAREMLDFLNASEKVDLSKVAGDVDLDQEAIKWREEFGEEGGRKLESWVRACMPDYVHMRSKRLTVDA